MTKLQKGLHYLIIIVGILGLLSIFPNSLYRLRYYTYLSNFIVVSFYIYYTFFNQNSTNTILRLKTGVTIMIALTFIVYNILLLPRVKPEEFWTFRNFSLHYAVPLLTIFNWIAFDKKIKYHIIDPLYWAIFPLIYCIISVFLGFVLQLPIPNEIQSPYPYFFVNVQSIGWNGLFFYASVITTAYIIIGYIMIAIKRIQQHKNK